MEGIQDIEDLIAFAKAWDSLGWAVQAQVEEILQGDGDDSNPNAVRLAVRAFRAFSEVSGPLQDWLDAQADK